MTVWFNPSCSKCRIARDQLEDAGVEYTLRRYLDEPPSEAELRSALAALGLGPLDITRMSEPLAGELGLADMPRDVDAWTGCWPSTPSSSSGPSFSPTTAGRGWPGTTRP